MKEFEPSRGVPPGIKWAIVGLVVLFVVGFIVTFFVVRAKAKQQVAASSSGITTGIADLEGFNFSGAAHEFSSLAASSSQFQSAAGAFSTVFGGSNPVGAFVDLSKNLATLSTTLGNIQSDLANSVSNVSLVSASSTSPSVSGTSLVADLQNLQSTLHAIDGDVSRLSSVASFVGDELPGGENFLSMETQLHGAESFLDAFTPWLASGTPHHVLVLLQNPSELRASGGFLGSYADVTIASGTITNIAIHDVADVDETFTPNIVPPTVLQLEEKRWRPADSNWFFDFPSSASETISFFENSGLYDGMATPSSPSTSYPIAPNSSTTFDGAIAISPQVISDILSVTGPLTVSSSKTTFASNNFLVQLQKVVQAGQAQYDKGKIIYPKQVLGDLLIKFS